jgi:phosphate transport system protein
MSKHLQSDLERLRRDLFHLSSLVVHSMDKAILALMSQHRDIADEVIEEDDEIDRREVEIEEDCLKALALHQPVAGDLRFIITAMKVNNDLERMGDMAVNIAERVRSLSAFERSEIDLNFRALTADVGNMVQMSLDALADNDTEKAYAVIERDDAVDFATHAMFDILLDYMKKDVDNIERAIHLLSASRHLERIADLATNIAQDVVYMVNGELIRHRSTGGQRRPTDSQE